MLKTYEKVRRDVTVVMVVDDIVFVFLDDFHVGEHV
jgi:hypothetical protein